MTAVAVGVGRTEFEKLIINHSKQKTHTKKQLLCDHCALARSDGWRLPICGYCFLYIEGRASRVHLRGCILYPQRGELSTLRCSVPYTALRGSSAVARVSIPGGRRPS